MGLYIPESKQYLKVDIKQTDETVNIEFSSNCGKFGTDEPIAGYTLTPDRLLEILQEHPNYTDKELE